MASFFIVYGSETGQTAKVARFVERVLAERGHSVTRTDVRDATTLPEIDYDGIVVASPVVNRAHVPEIVDFVGEHATTLREKPTAFVQLSFASILPSEWAQSGAIEWVDALAQGTDWVPDRIGLFPGAVTYTEYDWPTRAAFRLVSAVTTGDTDTSRDYEYTDWDEVESFAADFAAFVESGADAQATESDAAVVETAAGGGSRTVTIGTPTRDGTPVEPVVGEAAAGRARLIATIAGVIGLAGIGYWLARRRRRPES
ncbi:flavodoxin/nitric oxide synthase [Halovivax asiaticus JCM 14624]|uniref:Flavodoxin/nitric oxide synthase n=1 Tax=Halovivax asiaticus JCM 14624 TaxID=1227490 RepID=M0BNZ5_9EURY|nr:flavodoxin domain-containing protein [Halovivax asiaticus]ELZ12570.1 flavodoxin/nitric oxide synthase [Halovivax asiaticus JCM 14624]